MRRTGSALALLLLASRAALAADEGFYQTVDRTEVGTEDTFTLTVVVENPPADAQLKLPRSDDFEVLASHQSSQFRFNFGAGGSQAQRVLTHTLTLRANRDGKLTLPPAELLSREGNRKTEPVTLTVKRGAIGGGQAQRQRPGLIDPFSGLPLDDWGFPDPVIPRSDSDVFIKAALSSQEVFVGEQVTYQLYVYARVDLSSVDHQMPKLDGFWSEDLETPTHLTSDVREVNGVPYKVYLIKRRALFPMKPGTYQIEPAKAEIVVGYFDVRKLARKSNEISLKVKPLPPGGPAGVTAANVGNWRLFTEVSDTTVELGQPVTVKVILEGRGNLKNVTPPPLKGPPGVRVYDPTITDKLSLARGRVGGRRVHEYLVLTQQTGQFRLPGLEFPYFDPETGKHEVSRTDDILINVAPGAGGAAVGPGATAQADAARNVLQSGGIRPPRASNKLRPPSPPLYARPWFVPVAAAPLGLFGLAALVSAVRSRSRLVDEGTLQKRKAKDARRRLAAAEKLKGARPDAFYGEVEKALITFIEARLGSPVQGLTRQQLVERLTAARISEPSVRAVVSVLDACDLGRFAPGAASASRDQVLDQAEAAMEGFKA